jgi:hypothetical protein
MLKYIDIKSEEDTIKEEPNVLNNTIKEYSVEKLFFSTIFKFVNLFIGQDIKIKDPIISKKISNN